MKELMRILNSKWYVSRREGCEGKNLCSPFGRSTRSPRNNYSRKCGCRIRRLAPT